MDWKEFFASLVNSISWPLMIGIAICAFKREIANLLPLVTKLRAGPMEASFREKVSDIERESSEIAIEPSQTDSIDDELERLTELARISPRAAIIESWLKLEFTLSTLVWRNAGSPAPDTSTPHKLMLELKSLNLLDSTEMNLLKKLQGLRNEAVHLAETSISSASAKDYIEVSQKLKAKLESQLKGI